MSYLLGTILIVLFARAAFGGVVPVVQHKNVFVEPVNDTTYKLSIYSDSGVREETVELIKPGELLIKGKLRQTYYIPYGNLVVTYEAGLNGFVAKYSFKATEVQVSYKPAPKVVPLSVAACKSACG